MPTFSYRIRDMDGRSVRGRVEANSQAEAVEQVHKLGGIMLEVSQMSAGSGSRRFSLPARLPFKEKIIFTEQLAVMLRAGITLVQGLKGLQEETLNHTLAQVLGTVMADVEGGLPFSKALMKHPSVFSPIYCQMVRSAEKTGNLAEVLAKLAIQQQKEYDLKGKVRGALMYPAIIFILLVSVVIMVITFILPKLTGLFTESNVQLPASTKILLGLSNLFVNQGVFLLIGFFAFLAGFRYFIRTEKGRFAWDAFKIRLPVLGTFMRKSYMARFCQSFASLNQAGIPVLEAFQTLEGVIGNAVYEGEIKKIAHDVENGIKVSTAIRKSKYFPGMIGQLASVGEQSGDLAGIFVVLGEFFEKEVDGMARNLSTLLEPIIMVVMGAGVGFVLISIMQPILNLTSSI